MLCDKADFIKRKESLEEEINITVEMTQNLVSENARIAQNQDEYNKRYNSLVERYEQLGRFITVLKDQKELITEFDEAL